MESDQRLEGASSMPHDVHSSQHESIHKPLEAMMKIRGLPGNNQCCDCATYQDIQWSSVSHGILLCLDCAGRHRSLGVQVSIVKSLQMDEWEPEQLLYLIESGNTRFKETVHQIDKDIDFSAPNAIHTVYLSTAVEKYRNELHKQVLHISSQDQQNGQRHSGMQSIWPWDRPSAITPPLPLLNGQRSHDSTSNFSRTNSSISVTVTFPHGDGPAPCPLGMTLTKDSETGQAFVSKLVRGGAAHSKGVRVQDHVEEVNSIRTETYQETMQCVQASSRPISFTFSRVIVTSIDVLCDAPSEEPSKLSDSQLKDDGGDVIQDTVKNDTGVDVGSLDFRVTFPAAPLGIAVVCDTKGVGHENEGAIIAPAKVNKVVEGSQAQELGIRPGDFVVGVDGQWVAGYSDFINQVKNPSFPLTLIIRRQHPERKLTLDSSS